MCVITSNGVGVMAMTGRMKWRRVYGERQDGEGCEGYRAMVGSVRHRTGAIVGDGEPARC